MSNITKCRVAICLAAFLAGPTFAKDCYQSTILSPTSFMGNNGEIFRPADRSLWEVNYDCDYMYDYKPDVILCAKRERLILNKKSLNVALVARGRLSPLQAQPTTPPAKWELYEETQLKGSISGTVTRGSIFKTTSGNVYEVTGLTLQLVLELQPDVMVLRSGDTYKLVVKGFDEPLLCRKLN
jgi:hypothetical protein